MKAINLQETNFVLGEMVNSLPSTLAFKGDKLQRFQDFGTVFIGHVSPEDKEMSLPQEGAPVFQAPFQWKMPQLLKALGAFASTGQARKNGWDGEIPSGAFSVVIKVNKIKGEIWIHKGEVEKEPVWTYQNGKFSRYSR
jgi:hypothetical protein